ncbi:biopolymer transporter ExbD [Pseudenhygromyxa sp. WMMC2535]|uniref:ExbD/TolR family protein n=1 Tax=Pseudenhygromyxa sp. WMMC2535 TaxID=2712867 RepID=UPI001557F0D7|nr:biopolymer transporter ExbD [Pseudenhygromyxa sp. WMMC2535]NVB40782.1 biopolymer transporter ExbD [Pseudenhygromyxa sp. WMMC2535]
MRSRKPEKLDVPEANVLPVMNIMFLLIPALLLAMEVASMASISISPPKLCGAVCSKSEPTQPQVEPLNLKVFIRADGFSVASAEQQVGADAGRARDSSAPTLPLARPSAAADDYERYDYAGLEAMAAELIERYPHEIRVSIGAENDVPAQVLINTMDALRGGECKLAEFAAGDDRPQGCYFYEAIVEAGAG